MKLLLVKLLITLGYGVYLDTTPTEKLVCAGFACTDNRELYRDYYKKGAIRIHCEYIGLKEECGVMQ